MTYNIETAIANHTAAIARIERALDMGKNTLASHGWIVAYPGDLATAYQFDVIDHPTRKGRKLATNARPGCPVRVNRFTKEDAQSVAADCRDGKGDALVAVHWIDAAEAALASHKGVLEFLGTMAA